MMTASMVYAELQPWGIKCYEAQVSLIPRDTDLRSEQLHAEGATIQDVATAQHRVDHPHKRRVEGERVLEYEGEQDVVLALRLFKFDHVSRQWRVSVHATDLDIPLVQGVVNKLNLIVTIKYLK